MKSQGGPARPWKFPWNRRPGGRCRAVAQSDPIRPCELRARVLFVLLAAAWMACADPHVEPPEPENRGPVAAQTISALTVSVGDTATLNLLAHFTDPDGDALMFTAESSDTKVAIAAMAGSTARISGLARGTATITVMAFDPDGLSAQQSFAVTVPNRAPVTDSIPALQLVSGESTVIVLSAHFNDPDGDSLTYAAETSDEDVVAVTASLDTVTVTAAAHGMATVTVTATDSEGLSTAYDIEAGVEWPVPTTVVVTPDSVLMTALGDTVALAAEALDQIGRPLPDAEISWESGDPAVATVDSAGTASATGNGAARITATAEEASGEAQLMVRQVARSVTVSPATSVLVADDTLRLEAIALDGNGFEMTQAVFAWSSQEPSVARVDSGGLVTGVSEGGATIIVKVDGKLDSATITVEHQDRAALVTFHEATGGSGWAKRRNWLTDAPVRRWHGVRALEGGRVSGLILEDNGLAGTLPPELGTMEGLKQLVLAHNEELTGELPVSLASLEPLSKLLTGGTQLCAPSDAAFLAWLEEIPETRVARCDAAAAYLTQSVQSRHHPVPLVAGEEALLRVFVTAARSGGDRIPRIRATFYLQGGRRFIRDIPEKAGMLPTEVDESDLGISANAPVPATWVRPGLEIVIDVDPAGTLDPSLGVPKRIPETGRLAVPVHVLPGFDLTLVPFLWEPQPDSAAIDSIASMAADPGGHPLLWATHALLPVADLAVTAHVPVVTTSNYPPDVLSQTLAIQALEGGTGYYMGMMTGRLTSRIRGAAYVSGRSSFSVPHATTMAHEFAHNLSLLHAPCGGSGLLDPSYPFRDGSIGAWGYDFRTGELVQPSRRDLMSYCSRRWVGDYHFANALRYRTDHEEALAARADPVPVKSLLLWGGVDAAGRLHIEPVLAAAIPPAPPPPPGPYLVTGHTRDGRELFSVRFAMTAVEDGDGGAGFVYALPVRPGWADSLASITLSGPEGSVTLDESADDPLAILRDARTGQVRALLRGENAVLAAQQGAAPSSGEPGTLVLFSRGLPSKLYYTK